MDRNTIPRRRVLQAAGGAAIAGLAGCVGDDGGSVTTTSSPYTNLPVTGDSVTVGVDVAKTGVYSDGGKRMLAGFRLAADHLNNGGGWIDGTEWGETLTGNGVLGKTVELAETDSGSKGDQAEQNCQRLIESDDAVCLVGGATGAVNHAHVHIADEAGVINMNGFAVSMDLTGADCSPYSFTEIFNAKNIALSLTDQLHVHGDVKYYQLLPNSDLGGSLSSAIREVFDGQGWTEVGTSSTRVGQRNYDDVLEEAAAANADVVVCNYSGLDGAQMLRAADGVIDASLIVPVFDQPMALNAGTAIDDVLGTVQWDSAIDTPLSNTFTESWIETYGGNPNHPAVPSGLDHLGYVQLFQWAAAAERAGSFAPPAVVDALEGHSYDTGFGRETMRDCDHQAQRPVPVVHGHHDLESFYEMHGTVQSADYGCDEAPAANCEMDAIQS
jgi:ABC-type branched-subunit amino acid transport system substrate-binding protein